MDFYGFAKPGTEFAKPKMEDFQDWDTSDGYGYDYYAFDMAMEQWRSQFPDLSERWCPIERPDRRPGKPEVFEDFDIDELIKELFE